MRHRNKINQLGRKAPHRKAMLANMASSLIIHKRITTTTAKAKALRSFVEPVITRSREDSTHARRIAFRQLRDKEAVNELFKDVAGKIGDRPGGYTRIIKIGNRPGDSADMCIIELVDYNETYLSDKAAVKTRTSRRRRGTKKKTGQPVATPLAESPAEEEGTGIAEPSSQVDESAEAEPSPGETVAAEETAGAGDEEASEEVPSDEAGPSGEPDASDEEIPSDKETR